MPLSGRLQRRIETPESNFEKAFDLSSERYEIDCDRLPDDGQIYAEVLVDQDVSHAGDVSPRYIGRGALLIRHQVTGGFADDFEIPDDGVDGLLVGSKLFEA